jgi:hypothetical protein
LGHADVGSILNAASHWLPGLEEAARKLDQAL